MRPGKAASRADSADTGAGGPDDTAADSAEETGDPKPVDLDGDGYADDVDCDDLNATVHPGAEEWCDPVDHDCDGEPLADGVCGKAQDIDAVGHKEMVTGDGNWFALTPDVTGDGIAEIYLMCTSFACDQYNPVDQAGGYGLLHLPAERTATLPDWTDLVTHRWAADVSGTGEDGINPVADVDGDGAPDLTNTSHERGPGLYLVGGPVEPDGGMDNVAGDADAHWTTPGPEIAWGFPAVGGSDFDDDGRADTLVCQYADHETGYGAFDVIFGGPLDREGTVYSRIMGYECQDMNALPDIDGDGIDDVMYENAGANFLSGADMRSADGAAVSDLILATWTADRSEDSTPREEFDYVRGIGDWVGDGGQTIALGQGGAEYDGEQVGEMLLLQTPLPRTVSLNDAVGSWVGVAKYYPFGKYVDTADLDADGADDVIVRVAHANTWLIPHHSGIPGMHNPVDEVGLMYGDAEDRAWMGATAHCDITGDGIDDAIAVHNTDNVLSVIPGWEIPWDEPRYW